jgi:predicted negative regulator of RcsB-dependent stress response
MAKRKGMTKKELRAPDEFQSLVLELTERYGHYWKIALAVLILIIIIPLAITGYNYYKTNKENKAAIGYTTLTNSLKSLQLEQKISEIDKFINNHSGTKAAFFAMLLKGKLLYEQNKLEQAVAVFKNIMSQTEEAEFNSLAKLNIALCKEKSGNFNEAVSDLKTLQNDPIAGADATFYLAQIFEKQNKKAEAKNLYQEIVDKYKDYPYYKLAEIKTSVL